MNNPLPPILVMYDGTCGFCDASVQWLISHDTDKKLHYAPLQGETAKAILARHPELPKGLDSIVLVEQTTAGESLRWYSTAAFSIARALPAPWRYLSFFSILPVFLTNIGYKLVARFRYQIWGKRESCRIPRPDERALFLP
jgi:predicted DCC family thiol-disulfide oxidoreductase YuxK